MTIPGQAITAGAVDAGAQAIADADGDAAHDLIRRYPKSWNRTLALAVLEAAAPHIASAERARLAAVIRELYGEPIGGMIANALEAGQL